MLTNEEDGVRGLELRRVLAHVDLEPVVDRRALLEQIRERREADGGDRYRRFANDLLSPEVLRILVSLSAELTDGRLIHTQGRDFRVAGLRRGVGAIWHRYHGPPLSADPEEQDEILDRTYRVGHADIEDAINQMLGRDPEQHRPPKLSWGKLIAALADVGVEASEHDLIEAPLTIELSSDLQAEISGGEPGRAEPRAWRARAGKAERPVISSVTKGGLDWPVGTESDVAWITEGTTTGLTITSAIPPVFDAYATIVLPDGATDEKQRHDQAVIELLRAQSAEQPWWLGYLETGASDVVFPEARRVVMYADWSYVLVQAGPEQALRWRADGRFHHRLLPDLIFPADRSWLLSTLWDDDWTCLGGPAELVDAFTQHPDLQINARRVHLGEDATPPGHTAF